MVSIDRAMQRTPGHQPIKRLATRVHAEPRRGGKYIRESCKTDTSSAPSTIKASCYFLSEAKPL